MAFCAEKKSILRLRPGAVVWSAAKTLSRFGPDRLQRKTGRVQPAGERGWRWIWVVRLTGAPRWLTPGFALPLPSPCNSRNNAFFFFSEGVQDQCIRSVIEYKIKRGERKPPPQGTSLCMFCILTLTLLLTATQGVTLGSYHPGNILASSSADKTVKIWDVAVTTLEHHNAKVQAVAWNQRSPQLILSGSFDKSVALKDVKSCAPDCIRWSVEADVETVAWDPHNEHSFVVSLENGMVQAFDKRRASSNQNSSLAMFTLHAHRKAVSSISFGPSAPNVKLWDISSNQPSCIASRDPEVGKIFSASFSNDSPFLLAVGGSEGKVKILDTLTVTSVANKFGRCGSAKSS